MLANSQHFRTYSYIFALKINRMRNFIEIDIPPLPGGTMWLRDSPEGAVH